MVRPPEYSGSRRAPRQGSPATFLPYFRVCFESPSKTIEFLLISLERLFKFLFDNAMQLRCAGHVSAFAMEYITLHPHLHFRIGLWQRPQSAFITILGALAIPGSGMLLAGDLGYPYRFSGMFFHRMKINTRRTAIGFGNPPGF
jgi:hypothetical protein